MLLSEAFDLYKTNYLLIKGISKRVLQDNDYVKKRLVNAIGDKPVENLTMDDIASWVVVISKRELPNGEVVDRKQNTMRNDLTRLKMVLKYLHLRGIKCLEPELIPIPKREDVVRPFLTAEEVNKMIECAYSVRNKFIVSFFYSSGVRLSEFLSLDIDSIVDRKFTVVGKGKKSRLCFIDERTEELMREYLASREDSCPALVVSNMHKERMTSTNVQLVIKNTALRAGITKKVSPHILRHSFATNFIQNNGNIRYLSAMLGHASINTTVIYTHVVDNDLECQYRLFHSVKSRKSFAQEYQGYSYFGLEKYGTLRYN